MTQAVSLILKEVRQLSPAERTDLADRIVERLADDIPPAVAASQIVEVGSGLAQSPRKRRQFVIAECDHLHA